MGVGEEHVLPIDQSHPGQFRVYNIKTHPFVSHSLSNTQLLIKPPLVGLFISLRSFFQCILGASLQKPWEKPATKTVEFNCSATTQLEFMTRSEYV